MVSVIMITYGHAPYILQAIEGVLNQECNFAIELIIANDCSPDNTDEIVRKVISSHPRAEWIKYKRHDVNVGMQRNYMWAAAQASGNFIANCEGDDYWTDPTKLQMQIDFLESNPDYELCFHQVLELRDGVTSLSPLNGSADTTYELRDLAVRNFIHTPSVVYRRLNEGFPQWFEKVPAGDYPLYTLLARKGLIRYIAKPMAVYRMHSSGIWSSQSRLMVLEKWYETLQYILTLDFAPEIRTVLHDQARKTITERLLLLQKTDESTFLNELETYAKADPQLMNDWLFIHYPAQIQSLKQSRSHKLATKLVKLGDRISGNPRESGFRSDRQA